MVFLSCSLDVSNQRITHPMRIRRVKSATFARKIPLASRARIYFPRRHANDVSAECTTKFGIELSTASASGWAKKHALTSRPDQIL
ncbi:hypothetical protein EVAR_21659_1 [Eumeta japonica]|uniref:Uncharacterized protein n=1 Tax=Eumeta variegata TaxID=151549 RepID=A0A4C1VG06_EUMVA|nr:hypothetical protein EVAR_21659_1 [Eumeta japonica]